MDNTNKPDTRDDMADLREWLRGSFEQFLRSDGRMDTPEGCSIAADYAMARLLTYHEKEARWREAQARKEGARRGFLAGFNSSGEGFNGEYPFGNHSMDPGKDPEFVERLEDFIDALTNETEAK